MLPTPVFFYGMEPGQEIFVDIERGKTLIVRYRRDERADDEGMRTVFFELNGQPRSVQVRRPQPGGEAAAAPQGRARQSRSTSARRCRASSRRSPSVAGAEGGARRRAAVDRSDEDGNRAAAPRRTARSPKCWRDRQRVDAKDLLVAFK